MKEILIDCASFATPGDFHGFVAQALALPSHYGRNLDALYDCLTALGETRLAILNPQALVQNLGPYGAAITNVLEDAARDNPRLIADFL